ncbi:MAG: phosphomethylpyrimidine synthase ThiC [Methanosarcinales archaeon]|nr:phosphomethylpyrimidine synthase ThiC [Methanosarcinales archaeon]
MKNTLIESAKSRDLVPRIKEAAGYEGIKPEKMASLVAQGRVVIPMNILREHISPVAVGECTSTKVNANIGTSREHSDIEEEVLKARTAVQYGADTIMDLSTGTDMDSVRRRLLKEINVPLGTVPIYQAVASKSSVLDINKDDMFNAVRRHVENGVDFVTVHAGVTLRGLELLRSQGRILDIVSRGGSFLAAWMLHHATENPFYTEFDYLLEIVKEYDVTLSLGDGMRPGAIADASDRAMFEEIITLGELVNKARDHGVQSMVEGPGHIPLDKIESCVQSMKQICANAPLYLLGPLVTDIAPGYDHITAAMGGAVAGMAGADFLCMTTPAEHLALPTVEDIHDGAVVTKIAACAVDLVKTGQRKKALDRNTKMAEARHDLDWEGQFRLALDPERAKKIHSGCKDSKTCSMCGEFCSIKIMRETF